MDFDNGRKLVSLKIRMVETSLVRKHRCILVVVEYAQR
jgi:hypothetical protein